MKIVLKQISWITVFLVGFGYGTAQGQEALEKLCREVENSIVQSFKPAKIDRKDIFKSDCKYEFDTPDGESVYISIEKYDSSGKSHKALQSDRRFFIAHSVAGGKVKFSRANLSTNGIWDEAIFYRSDEKDNFILLRKNNFDVVLISSNDNILRELEIKFRGIIF